MKFEEWLKSITPSGQSVPAEKLVAAALAAGWTEVPPPATKWWQKKSDDASNTRVIAKGDYTAQINMGEAAHGYFHGGAVESSGAEVTFRPYVRFAGRASSGGNACWDTIISEPSVMDGIGFFARTVACPEPVVEIAPPAYTYATSSDVAYVNASERMFLSEARKALAGYTASVESQFNDAAAEFATAKK